MSSKLGGIKLLQNHEIDYKILGDDLQMVVIGLDPCEAVIAEAGTFTLMDDFIQMETIMGDGSEQGFGSKLLGLGKRILANESAFLTSFTNVSDDYRKVVFSAPYPGKIIPLNLKEYGNKIICQKGAYLCGAKGVSLGIEFTQKLSAGFFGGEGFILQRIVGDGMAFVHAGGAVIKRDLQPGEVLRIDTGALVAMTKDVSYEIEMIKSVKSVLFSNHGIFNTVVRGPGTVWIQSMPFNKLVNMISARIPQNVSGGSINDWN